MTAGGEDYAESQEAIWLAAAARGDLEAQRALVHFCLAHSLHGVSVFEAVTLAEPFARLACEQGQPIDALLLADVLLMRSVELGKLGETHRAGIARETAFALYDEVAQRGDREALAALVTCLTAAADNGDEAAAERINRVMDGLSAKEATAVRRASKQQLAESNTYWRTISEIAAQ